MTYRIQMLWLPRGALIGAATGAVVGAYLTASLVLFDEATAGGPWALLAGLVAFGGVGATIGSVTGAIVGCLAGIPLVFLVGRHLPLEVARRRAFALGLVLTPIGTAAAFSLVSGDWSMLADGWHDPSWWLESSLFVVPALAGAPLAAWAAGQDLRLPRPPVS